MLIPLRIQKLPHDRMSQSHDILARLMETLRQRAIEMPPNSYTTKLLTGGVPKIGSKITEEAAEVIEAAAEPGDEGRDHFVREVADLVFHTMVMMAHREVDWEDAAGELARREGLSGLEEKRRRGQGALDE
ncbi:MAG: phosphoribosyl-ATP diphosphatase [Planctomycetales bacterium]|nr:phosphoribosyl-ATP diphosphatase [Planctomycetales bacterium]